MIAAFTKSTCRVAQRNISKLSQHWARFTGKLKMVQPCWSVPVSLMKRSSSFQNNDYIFLTRFGRIIKFLIFSFSLQCRNYESVHCFYEFKWLLFTFNKPFFFFLLPSCGKMGRQLDALSCMLSKRKFKIPLLDS